MKKTGSFLLLLLMLAACADKHREIPYNVLEDMFADIVLTDSYVKTVTKPNRKMRDTTDYFTPILDRYGYTIEDLEYTIDKMSRRKSDVISNTLNNAGEKVAVIQRKYDRNNRLRMDWNKQVEELTLDTLYYNTDTIHITRPKDLEALQFRYPVMQEGIFTVSYDYFSGPQEKNNSQYFVYRTGDSLSGRDPRRQSFWISKTREGQQRITKRTIAVPDLYKGNYVEIDLWSYDNQRAIRRKPEKPERMDTRLTNILITFKPYAAAVANDIFYREYPYPFILDIRKPYADSLGRDIQTPFSYETLGIRADSTFFPDTPRP